MYPLQKCPNCETEYYNKLPIYRCPVCKGTNVKILAVKMDIENLDSMIRSREFEFYLSDKLGNDLYINDPERAERIQKAAENGSDGSTHAETIEDWREYLNCLKVFDPENDDCEDMGKFDITQETYNKIIKEIDNCEEYHNSKGTLDQEIG